MNEVKFKYLNKLIFNQNSIIRDIIKIFNEMAGFIMLFRVVVQLN